MQRAKGCTVALSKSTRERVYLPMYQRACAPYVGACAVSWQAVAFARARASSAIVQDIVRRTRCRS
eukprot:3509717-Lingulodinium_polyedra.AAC.1